MTTDQRLWALNRIDELTKAGENTWIAALWQIALELDRIADFQATLAASAEENQ